MALKRELRVGVFVLAGLSVMGLVIFLIGDARRVFEGKTMYQTTFSDVEGLVPGSLVRMGGVDIGRVQEVRFSEDATRSDIVVTLSVVSDDARRIRVDSIATIEAKGMLGDKLLSITPGSPDKPRLKDNEFILSGEGNGLLGKLSSLGEKAEAVILNLEKTSGTLAEPEFRENVRGTVEAAHDLLDAMKNGEGYVPRLIQDKDEADRLSHAISSLDSAATQLNQVLREANATAKRINEGPGLAHELIYGESGSKAAEQFGQASEEFALTLKGIREGDGLAHQILYGGGDSNSEKIVADLAAITSDVRVLTRNMREGKGTIGALMVDPSVYEDLKVLLGNVQRNEVLRALVRYSIKQDEQRPKVEVTDPEPPSNDTGQAQK